MVNNKDIRRRMNHYKWDTIADETLKPLVSRRAIHTEHMTIARLTLGKGALVPLHQHVNEQVSNVESGALRFVIDDQELIVRAGESVCIPPNAPHLVLALEDTQVTDIFTPRREDWISGDDAYLRR